MRVPYGDAVGTRPDRDCYQYGHDYNSNRMYRKNELKTEFGELYHVNDATANSEYDGLDRLKEFRRGTLHAGNRSITGNDKRRQLFTLDQIGNWAGFKDDEGAGGVGNWDLDQTRDNNKVNEITDIDKTAGADWVVPAYDARGNMTSGPKPSGPNTGDETTKLHFKYDAWNRLIDVRNDDEGDPGTIIVTYRYDAAGRRIRKLLGGDPDNTYDYFFNNSWQIIEVRKDGLEAVKLYEQYVWSLRYIDSPILRDRDVAAGGNLGKTGSGLDERLYYTTDANMNVTALVDTDGNVAERYVYDAYGKATIYNPGWTATVDWADSKQNEILYCGYRYDPESNLYHVRMRMYHPTLGRWLQRDPLGYVDGMDLYEYVGSDPIGLLDMMGMVTTEWTPIHKDKKGHYTFWVFLRARGDVSNEDLAIAMVQGGGRMGTIGLLGAYIKAMKEGKPCECLWRAGRLVRRCRDVRKGMIIETKLQLSAHAEPVAWTVLRGPAVTVTKGVWRTHPTRKNTLYCDCRRRDGMRLLDRRAKTVEKADKWYDRSRPVPNPDEVWPNDAYTRRRNALARIQLAVVKAQIKGARMRWRKKWGSGWGAYPESEFFDKPMSDPSIFMMLQVEGVVALRAKRFALEKSILRCLSPSKRIKYWQEIGKEMRLK